MCYDIHASLKAQLNRAKQNNDAASIKEIEEKLVPLTDLPLYHVSGFDHPQLFIYTNESPYTPSLSTWGLIPSWVKNMEEAKLWWNKSLNARGETIFEKASFKDSAKNKRCLIYIDGFYEYHHHQGETYPYYIYHQDKKPLALAGLWNEFFDSNTGKTLNTFSIVTTKANKLMQEIHNNPKLKEARMPLVLAEELENEWLKDIEDELDEKKLKELIQELPEDVLKSHTVNNLKGKKAVGNTKKAIKKVQYKALNSHTDRYGNYTIPFEF